MEKAKQRSRDYYRSIEGKIKKKYLNARRNGRQPELSPNEKPTISAEFEVDKTTVFHIQMVTSLIEGRSVTIKEIIGLIDRIVRQHSIDKRGKIFYAAAYHYKSPP